MQVRRSQYVDGFLYDLLVRQQNIYYTYTNSIYTRICICSIYSYILLYAYIYIDIDIDIYYYNYTLHTMLMGQPHQYTHTIVNGKKMFLNH